MLKGAILQEGEWLLCVEIISIVKESESEGLRLMESLPCKGCKGLCCGPVPITEEEFEQIKKKLKSMPKKLKLYLKSR